MILVIEDEEDVRELVEAILSTATRHPVLTAGSLAQAEALWAERKNEIQIVLSDLNLPDAEPAPILMARWQQEKPALRVVYMSGMAAEQEMGIALVEGTNFLPKPFTTRELIEIASLAPTHSECRQEIARRTAA